MKNKKVLILSFFLLVLTLLLGVIEIYLRKFQFEVLKTHTFPLIYQPDSIYGYQFIPNTSSSYVSPSVVESLRINSQGFVGREFSVKKEDMVFRILIVSYSIARNGKFVTNVQGELKKRNFNNVEVINCSIDGTNLNWHHFLMIKTKLLKYHPDMIFFETDIPFSSVPYTRECYRGYVLEYCWNSRESRNICTNAIDRIEDNIFLTHLYDNCYIVRAICKKMVDRSEYNYGTFTQKYIAPYRKKKVLSGGFKKDTFTVEQTMKHIKALSYSLSSKNKKLVIFDYLSNKSSARKEQFCKINKIQYLNLGIDPTFYSSNLQLEHDGHPNSEGYKTIATKFVEHLLINNFFCNNSSNRKYTNQIKPIIKLDNAL